MHAQMQRSGFTLIEMVVVLAIIGGLSAFIGPRIFRWYEKRKVHQVQGELRIIKGLILEYDMDKGKHPGSLNDLVKEKLLKQAKTRDPWGRPYVYKLNPEGAEELYALYSRGKDGKRKIEV